MLNSLRSCSIPAAAGEWGWGSRPSPSPLRGSPRLPARVGGLCSGRPGGGSSAYGLASPGRRGGLVLVPSLRGAAALLRTSGRAPGGALPSGAAAPRRGVVVGRRPGPRLALARAPGPLRCRGAAPPGPPLRGRLRPAPGVGCLAPFGRSLGGPGAPALGLLRPFGACAARVSSRPPLAPFGRSHTERES